MTRYQPQTARQTLARIHAGVDPWIAIGDLLDDRRRTNHVTRASIVEEPLDQATSDDEHRWAGFIAAAVDQLAWESEPRIEPPGWVRDDRYILSEPWFLLPGWRPRMHQLVDAPAAFRRRNIYGVRIISRV